MSHSLHLIQTFLNERMGLEPSVVLPEASLESLGIDSLMQMEMIFDVEDQFDFHMPDLEDRPSTVGQLMALLDEHIPASNLAKGGA